MKLLSALIFLMGLASSASAINAAPAPEMTSGILGLSLAGGIVYLINRRKRG